MSGGTTRSRAAFQRARRVLVGGVNSPVRAFAAVGGEPVFIASAAGAHVFDADGNRYVDYVGGYGPAILGHAHPDVVAAVADAATRGLCFGAPTEAETELAEAITAAVPSAQKVRLVSSGTEAAMTAVRLARGATGRTKVVKCAGCYHGHADALLVAAGSGATTLGVPSSPGVPTGATADTMLAAFNDAEAVDRALTEAAGDAAAVLVEPVAGNMGVVPPAEGYLPALRAACDRAGALLIFDEVMTGFRVAPGGAQQRYNVRPDLTVLGKVIGGGLPIGAVAGPAALMDQLAPEGPVYQAGTLSGNPAATAAGLATLRALADGRAYELLERRGAALEAGLREAGRQAGLDGRVCVQRVGSMLSCFFAPGPVRNYEDARACDTTAFAAFFRAMLAEGVFLAPSQFEAMFVSTAHTADDVDATIAAAERAFAAAAT